MSVTFGVDFETGLVSEQSGFRGAGTVGDDTPGECRTEYQPGTENSDGVDVVADSSFGNTSEKTSDFYPIRSERHVDVVLESWKCSRESTLLMVGLLVTTILLFVIEGYNTLSSQDVVDQAVALFIQVAPMDQPFGPDAVPLERGSSAVRATTLWLLSLWLNITCLIWVSWPQWLQQCINLLKPYMPARVRPYLLPGVGTGPTKHHIIAEENWVLLNTSVIIFFVGLVDFLLWINKTITWILLGYLAPLAFLYAAVTLLP